MRTYTFKIHDQRVLWPDHKPLDEILVIRDTSPESVWEATYQGRPTSPAGTVFKRAWWNRQNRYDLQNQKIRNEIYARFISWDTGQKDNRRPDDDHDPSAYIVAELWPDYRLAIRAAGTERLEFPELPDEIEAIAQKWNYDEKLRAVIIEDKVSGTSAIQTLRATTAGGLRELIIPFMPTTDKVTRAGQAAVWCKNSCILLPYADLSAYWLVDLEDQLFDFPRAAHDDLVDALSQLILYLENYIEHGYFARQESEQ